MHGRDDGYFPAGSSLLRRVHSERSVGLHFGQRALLIGALNPLNYAGTALHTRDPSRPYKRLADTARSFETIFFGTRAEADRELHRIHLMHERVTGVLPASAGPYEAGTPYAAYDPGLMLWTLACIADSGRALFEATVRPLGSEELEDLWRDYLRLGELFGMPREAAPATHPELRAWWEETLAGDGMHLTPSAREAGLSSAFRIPVPPAGRPGMELGNLLVLGTTPEPVRRAYGLDWTPARQAAFRTACALIRTSRPAVPARLRRGANGRIFDLVERTERARIRRGTQCWHVST